MDKRTEVALFQNGKIVRGVLEHFNANDQALVTSGNADGTTNTLNFTNSTGGTFTVTNSSLLFNDGTEGYWSANTAGDITSGHRNVQLNDVIKLKFGDDDDLQIYSDSTNGRIGAGSGVLQIEADTLSFTDGAATEYYINCVANGAVSLYHDASLKIATTTTGIDVTGEVKGDSLDIDGNSQLDGTLTVGVDNTGYDVKFFGATAGRFMLWDEANDRLKLRDDTKLVFGHGNDLEIYHDGNNSYIDDTGTGTLKYRSGTQTFTNGDSSKTMAVFNGATSVDLYYNNAKKFETTNTGVDVTGNMVSTGVVQGGKLSNMASPTTALDIHHDPTTLGNNTGGGEVVTFGTASGTLTQGKLYYLNTSGVWTLTRANASSSNGNSQLLGIALGDNVDSGILLRGFFDMTTYLTGTFNEGISLYVCETTAGNINVAAPGAANEFIRVVGYTTSTANVIYFNPDGTYITLS